MANITDHSNLNFGFKSLVNLHSNDDLEDDEEINGLQWKNLIFLPFHPTFRVLVLVASLMKGFLGPLQSVYPIMFSDEFMGHNQLYATIKYVYLYCCDPIYGLDMFLHIMHRQATDEAMRREYLPKSGFFLVLDFIALVPFFRLISSDTYAPVQLWPNILAFSEFVTIYRLLGYFSLVETHSFWKIVCGCIPMLCLCVNCITCFILLMTAHGLCANCTEHIYDWRLNVEFKVNDTDQNYIIYVQATSYVLSLLKNRLIDTTKPSTLLEFVIATLVMAFGSLVITFIVFPKLVCETMLRKHRISEYLKYVQVIIKETERRNPKAKYDVVNFYSLMWERRRGITQIPELICELPKYLRIELRQDLVWQVFYHSPTLRRTSNPFKRWICEKIRLDYRLPGEKFYVGIHAHSQLYYLKTGIVQLFSDDDNNTPLLSVTSGTVFGDISFFVPPIDRKILVYCLTYCEVCYISRADIIQSIHKFSEDRKHIISCATERIKHARTLYTCKQLIKGIDRAEDEGIGWVKKRWWEISNAVTNWKQCPVKNSQYIIPPEETVYHCSKYIGQLVLCSNDQLQMKSPFMDVKFPWILVPHTSFIEFWKTVHMITIYLVVVLYPPLIMKRDAPFWFYCLQYWTDTIYITDILISLMTPTKHQEDNMVSSYEIMFARCKTPEFIIDVLSTLWLENFVVIIGKPDWYHLCQFNRVLRVYILFIDRFRYNQHLEKKELIKPTLHKIFLLHIVFAHVFGYFFQEVVLRTPDLSSEYWHDIYCIDSPQSKCETEFIPKTVSIVSEGTPKTLMDSYVALALSIVRLALHFFCNASLVSTLYLSLRDIVNYQYFVTSIRKYYQNYKIHPYLLKRLNRYLMCHWKYFKGTAVMHPNLLNNEPFDIYWKVQGEVAVTIIGGSRAFIGANPALIRELAHKAKFLILPKNTYITMFGIVNKNMCWLSQGHVKCEYHNEKGELIHAYYSSGQMISISSVYIRHAAMRTYTTHSDCETLIIKRSDFINILQRYPIEKSYFENSAHEFKKTFAETFFKYFAQHKEYQTKLRARIFKARTSFKPPPVKSTKTILRENVKLIFSGKFYIDPESRMMMFWCPFRAFVVFVAIVSASLQGSRGAMVRKYFVYINTFCDIVAWIDIFLKFFVAFYDEHGILVTSFRKCSVHYLTRGFTMDLLGSLPNANVLDWVYDYGDHGVLNNTYKKMFHIYLLLGYFDYMSDTPTTSAILITLIKWQVLIILLMFVSSHYFFNKCVKMDWNDQYDLLNITKTDDCWMPDYVAMSKHPSIEDLCQLYAHSLSISQCGLIKINLGQYKMKDELLRSKAWVIYIFGLLYWYIKYHSISMLVLSKRSHSVFRHSVDQLRRFLEAERVDKKIIDRTLNHFRYWWIRTGAINIHNLINERVGVMFRQDLNYYFYKRTFSALDTVLNGGEQLQRLLACAGTVSYFLPREQVMREMDLTPWVYVVHRGRIMITRDSKTLAVLTKGAIFGQLFGSIPVPLPVTATADGYTDVIQISIKAFYETIYDEDRSDIVEKLKATNGYLNTEEEKSENPYNTVRYILRGKKSIQFPWMATPTDARSGTWYSYCLIVTWVVGPVIGAAMALPMPSMPLGLLFRTRVFIIVADVIHAFHILSEFFVMESVVVGGKCVDRRVGSRVFRTWTFYIDMVTIIMPIVAMVFRIVWLHTIRLFRLYLVYNFQKHFCKSFKTKAKPAVINAIVIVLVLHTMVCGWLIIGCYVPPGFHVRIPPLTEEANKTIDYTEWTTPFARDGYGCPRLIKQSATDNDTYSFVISKHWKNDYIVAMTYIVILYTQTDMDSVVPLSLPQTYFKVVLTFFLNFLSIWIWSLALGYVYTRLRELYHYDYNVKNLTTYLLFAGLSPKLVESIKKYTLQLWKRQSGNWLPELAHQAPICLRQDILGALYLHHLESVPMFRDMPSYFTRQLVTRLQRVVIFPGKVIVKEGDMYEILYFIHEGEVEKWFTNKSGEDRLHSVLTTGGYFGLVPSLFPNTPFLYSFVARTVVDLVTLRHKDLKDLLDRYPAINDDLYKVANHIRAREMDAFK